MGIASLVLGILSLLLVFSVQYQWLGILLGIVGIILGAMARKNGEGGVSTAGFVISIIGVALCLLTWIACVICTAAVIGAVNAGIPT